VRVAVDARELTGRPTGVGRYLAELLASWSRDPEARDTHITLFAPRPIDLPFERGQDGARIDTIVAAGGAGTRWEQLTLPRAIARRFDVLFCPGYSAPALTRVPFVVAIHDVSFFAHPEWFGAKARLRLRWLARRAARRAARVITISAFSRDEIVRLLGVSRDRVEVTWLAPWRSGTEGAAFSRAGTSRTILYVGSLFNRRQLPLLVRGFAPIARRDPYAKLVLVGENRTHPFEDPAAVARELGIAAAVDVRAYVADEELAALYREASAFVFLSTYEGFGLTPLEAMAAGVPVVACDTPVAREVYGEAALFVPPGDVDGVTRALTSVLEDDAVRERLAAAAARTLARFSWDATAQTTLDVLRRAAAGA
jgi:glycosyltransferase involved in cell wall biosynthesis